MALRNYRPFSLNTIDCEWVESHISDTTNVSVDTVVDSCGNQYQRVSLHSDRRVAVYRDFPQRDAETASQVAVYANRLLRNLDEIREELPAQYVGILDTNYVCPEISICVRTYGRRDSMCVDLFVVDGEEDDVVRPVQNVILHDGENTVEYSGDYYRVSMRFVIRNNVLVEYEMVEASRV